VTAKSTLRLVLADLATLGLETGLYPTGDHAAMQRVYEQTQRIGDAVAYLGCDGLLAPSARWACENLVLFTENHGTDMSTHQRRALLAVAPSAMNRSVSCSSPRVGRKFRSKDFLRSAVAIISGTGR